MFGKGIYFADVASKSVGYTAYHASNNTGLMLLCKVALGKTGDRYSSDSSLSLKTLPKGANCTKGCGWSIPDPKGKIKYDGCNLDTGKVIDSNDK